MGANLLSVGPLVFDLRVNLHQYSRESAEDFARKDVIGARRPYEHVGEGDERLTLSAKLFPDRLGGAGAVDALHEIKRTGSPQLVIRGDGKVFGFYVITSVQDSGEYLDASGRPRMVDVEVTLERCDQPSAADAFGSLLNLFG